MSKFFSFLLILLLICCKTEKSDDYYSDEKNETEFIEFAFPTFDKWTECYEDRKVKSHYDENLISNKFQNVAVYLNNETFLRKDSLGLIDYEDYAYFFINKNEQKWKLTGDDLKRIFQVQKRKNGIESYEKESALNKVYSDTTFLHSEKPIVIEEFKSAENIYSAVKLIKPYSDYHDIIIIYVYNLMIVKNHLIYSGYYLDLNGDESIMKAKEMNGLIMSKFLGINK